MSFNLASLYVIGLVSEEKKPDGRGGGVPSCNYSSKTTPFEDGGLISGSATFFSIPIINFIR